MNIQNNYKTGEIVWKDKKTNEIILILIILLSFIILSLAFFFINSFLERIIFAIIWFVIGLYALCVQLPRRLSKLFIYGILMGNINRARWHKLGLRKEYFINWAQVRHIELINYEVKVPRGSWERTFIVVKTKTNKKYECVVYDPKGFVNALKKLNKYRLLSKDSRYK